MIIISGTAGSGKTTQGKMLAARLGCPFFSMGELLRRYGDAELKAKMDAGQLLSNQDTLPVFETFFEGFHGSQTELVTDGFPRSADQAKWIIDQINEGKIKFTALIHLSLPEDEAIRRLSSRGRTDDSPEAIKTRLHDQDKAMVGVLEQFRSHGLKVIELSGEGDADKVAARIDEVLANAA